jgi:APA family basic amino acid/polyamine antiporter
MIMNTADSHPGELKRELGVFGATMMGLGSIVGTGVFVSIGIAAGITGPSVIVAIGLAAFVAMCNAFSSAQLAASHPVSGGTYEYGYRYLTPRAGFTAGWLFLCAKSASAATAALGFAGYLLHAGGLSSRFVVPVAAGTSVLLTVIVLTGIRRSNIVNTLIVSITLAALASFVVGGFTPAIENSRETFQPFLADESPIYALLQATALMFVAYTGYGRIATLGEEVKEPRKTIPAAIVTTLVVSAVLYMAVGAVAIGSVGARAMGHATEGDRAPLEVIARTFSMPGVHWAVSIGAMTAMLGVLLNLILGLSRVLLAMGRRGDMPGATAKLNVDQTTPWVAVIVMGLVVTGLACIGSVKTTWSFSAFTVLSYYALTNAACLRLPKEDQLYPRVFAWLGLGACLFLAFWVEWKVWVAGLCVIVFGQIWQLAMGGGRKTV